MVKVLFIQNIQREHYAVMLLSAVLLKYGHETDLVLGSFKEIRCKIRSYKPDLITISAMYPEKAWVERVCRYIKRFVNIPIVVGGAIAMSTPGLVNDPNIDALVCGEGEKAVVAIADRIHTGRDLTNIHNVLLELSSAKIPAKHAVVADLDGLPFADRVHLRQE